MHKFLVHKQGDHVGVATRDIQNGEEISGIFMDDNTKVEVVARGDIPLGHKIALQDLAQASDVIEYGQIVGVTKSAWQRGDYVHTHNIKSKRW
ncbi:UxaA family hydrolase [Alicyclobacillus fodiniaquatilis]|jgi:(2R)-sulfolactate sulfo-lyase subunit alpha|uniref:UxaA family hydrolase n=1 Tax=Alicyclobacillus fodiniaquatilis TaxID=1661150 RepID=A0ABW4JLI0_9BACL